MRSPASLTAADRRTADRARRPLDATFTGQSGRRPVRICDLSATGCFVESLETAAPGERVELRITIPDWSTIEVTGEVVYASAPLGYGVRFVNVPEATALILQAAVESLLHHES